MSKILKVGIVGVGGISNTHLPGWKASPHAEIVAGCDLREDILPDWGKDHDVKKLTSNPSDLFNDPDIDIIDVCVPNMYHAPLSIAALEAGKHVICEKPLAPKPSDIQKMIDARNKSGKLLMTAQHFRFQGNSKAMKAEIDQGTLGDIYHARSWMIRRWAIPTGSGFILKKNSGGGPCIDIGVHILDLTLWFMGNPNPVAVSGVAAAPLAKQDGSFTGWGHSEIPKEFDVEDYAVAFVRFENGATLVLEVSWLMHHRTTGEDMQMWLYGTKAGCHWPKCEFLWDDKENKSFEEKELKNFPETLEAHAQECVEFAQAIVDGAPSPVPPEQSKQVMSILDGIYQSQSAGKEVRIDQ